MSTKSFNKKGFNEALKVLNAIKNPKRLMILCHLNEKSMTVSELASTIDLQLSPTSQHLAILRSMDFVTTKKIEQHVYYSLKSKEIKQIIKLLYKLYCK